MRKFAEKLAEQRTKNKELNISLINQISFCIIFQAILKMIFFFCFFQIEKIRKFFKFLKILKKRKKM